MEQAVKRITSEPAEFFGLWDRGKLAAGMAADITIFDPANIIDEATYAEPTKLSQGVDYVIINGQVEFDHGTLTAAKAGRPLRGPGYRATQ